MTMNDTPLQVGVLLFARYEELLGTDALRVTLPAGATVADAIARVRALPGGSALPATLLVAVNHQQAPLDTALNSGDEVALLPPMAGG